MNPLIALTVFSCAALHEVFCVAFVHYSERDKPKMTGLMTGCAGTVTVISWTNALSNPIYLGFLIAGWAFGGYLGVKINIWRKRRSEVLND